MSQNNHIAKHNIALIEAVAALLGGTVLDTNSDWSRSVRLADGITLFFKFQTYGAGQDRVTVSYQQPRDREGTHHTIYDNATHSRVSTPEVGFSNNRSAEVIVKDLERRLLPDCRKVQALVLATHAAHDAQVDARDAAIRAAARAIGAKVRKGSADAAPDAVNLNRELVAYRGETRIEVTVGYEGNYELKISSVTLANLTSIEAILS